MPDPTHRKILAEGISALGLSLDNKQIEQLLAYIDLLVKWNRAYNLTAVTYGEEMIQRHLLDSLAILPFLRGVDFIDVGTGPGLPGIPLAIALPESHFVLLDSNGKRTRFLFQVRLALELANIEEVHARAEQYRPAALFDGVISRAFADLGEMLAHTRHLLKPRGRFYAMKGRYPEKELSAVAKAYTVSACHHLKVPGLDGDRHLVEVAFSPDGTVL